jgi:hypothetical protein
MVAGCGGKVSATADWVAVGADWSERVSGRTGNTRDWFAAEVVPGVLQRTGLGGCSLSRTRLWA